MKKHAMLILMWLSVVMTLLTAALGTLSLVGSSIERPVAEKMMIYPAQLLRVDGKLDLRTLNEGFVREGLPTIEVIDSNFPLAAWLASTNSARNVRWYRQTGYGLFVASGLGLLMCVTCWWGRPRANGD